MSEGKPKYTYEVRKFMKKAAKKGRRGADGVKDDRIVHVNAREEAMLKAAGGAGTINPKTGLREYRYGGAGVTEGMNSKEGTFSGGGLGGGGSGNAGGLSPAQKHHLDMKYPGASKKKSKSAELSLRNVGPLVGKFMDITNPMGAVVKKGLEAATGIDMPTFDDSFEGMGPDVPSRGAGYADGGKNDLNRTVVGLTAAKKKRGTKPSSPLGSVGTILNGIGGSLRTGGL